MTEIRFTAWAVQQRSDNRLDGKREYFAGRYDMPDTAGKLGCPILLFKTREEARKFISERFGYIRKSPDLRQEPHGWKMPRAVKIEGTITDRTPE